MINSCEWTNWTGYKCIGDVAIWTPSVSFGFAMTILVFSPLILLGITIFCAKIIKGIKRKEVEE